MHQLCGTTSYRVILTTLIIIQRSSARFVQGRGRWSLINTSPHPTVPKLSWDSLNHRRKLARLSLLYKTLNGAVSLPTDELIKQDSRTRGGKINLKHIRCNKTNMSHPFFQGQSVADPGIARRGSADLKK